MSPAWRILVVPSSLQRASAATTTTNMSRIVALLVVCATLKASDALMLGLSENSQEFLPLSTCKYFIGNN